MKRRIRPLAPARVALLGFFVACTADEADLAEEQDDLLFRSNLVQGHDHTVLVDADYFGLPPRDGVVLESSVDFGHSHAVVLTQEELGIVDAGGRIMKESSTEDGHSHLFDFSLIEDRPAI